MLYYYVDSEAPGAFIQQTPPQHWHASSGSITRSDQAKFYQRVESWKFQKSFIIFQTFYGNYRHAIYTLLHKRTPERGLWTRQTKANQSNQGVVESLHNRNEASLQFLTNTHQLCT